MYLERDRSKEAKARKTGLVQVSSVTVLIAICMLLVLLLHHATYTLDFFFPVRILKATKIFQRFAVGGFMFLSGFKLSRAKLTVNAKSFLYSRFIKIYVLYLLSLILFAFTAYPHLNEGSLPSAKNFVLHVFLLQSLLPNLLGQNFHTLWFVSVLFLCYLAFLLIRTQLLSLRRFVTISLGIITCIIAIRFLSRAHGLFLLQQDLEVWVSFFFLGMLYSKPGIRTKVLGIGRVRYVVLISVGCTLLLYLYNHTDSVSYIFFYCVELLLILSTLPAVYVLILAKDFWVSNRIKQILEYVAASSYCVFLLHRSIWAILVSVWPEHSLYQSFFILRVGLPIIFFSSYVIQSRYQKLISSKSFPPA